ncbi:cytoplasmic dynein 2 intermediate chain 1 isoform X2 [Mugil cephalus]|uniref:cytoplasmic dynein 2 intermediate chain 1 isoform X2 n=1 Tax=Mugil cephalus TaxID=48193 RepID=UPI001FB85140|nr:cytoplasmic dynein 2 intermediate chain 1 isoform X2 [Mugil cephalus]
MHSEKKITKEDTWRPADLRRHIKEEERGDGYVRRRDDNERRHRGGESVERRLRDSEKESRREREKLREKERRDDDKKDKYAERRKEGSQDRRGDKERDREKRRERDRLLDDHRENKTQDREERRDRERDKEKHRDKEKERIRDRERHNEDDRDKRREYRDKERRREERYREHRSERERKRHEESGEERRQEIEKQHREQRDRHRERQQHKNDNENVTLEEIHERRGDRKHSERKEDREYKEERQKHREERERRHKERGHHDEKRKHDSESRERWDLRGTGEEIRHHLGDRERTDKDSKDRRHRDEDEAERKHKERRHRDEEDAERKHKERRRRDEEDAERKHKERRDKDEEDAERKHKERRHRDEEDAERNHRDRTTSKKGHGPESNMVENEVANDEDLAEQEYEDDFEDYEEDFEDVSESEGEDERETAHQEAGEKREELTAQRRKEIEAIQRAMDEENQRAGTAQSGQSTSREEEDRPKGSKDSEKNQSRTSSQRGKFINFVAAKQREVSKKVATKQKKRSADLLRLIDLDFSVTHSLLDLPPVNEYDMYIRNFGTANTKQAYVQCNEDNVERDVQTEEIELCEKWTQHPPEHTGACGDPNVSQEDKTTSEINFDSQRLISFLHSASQVMVVLLEEDQAERKSLKNLKTQTDTLSFSDGSLQLNTKLPFLIGRQVSLLHFSQVQRHTMLSVHTPTTEPSSVRLDSCTIICIWNIWEPSQPQRILVYESEVQCCCFSPGKAVLVFAGTSVGSVVLWDLRERASNHFRLKIGEDEWIFRHPTFSTDAVMVGSGHFSPVTSVEVVPSTAAEGLRSEVPLLASEEESSGLSFQLASLDESGVLNFWVVVELPKGNEAGSATDLGLRPGGKVKLLHSSSLLTAERVSPRDAVKREPLQTLLLKFLPTDSNHFFIGTNMGLVNHGTSHGLKAPPKFYRFQEVGLRPVDVSSIHFSPFRQHLFLVGCGNGTIRLHAVSHEQPVAEWKDGTAGEAVISLQWTQTRPTVFCVLDAASNLHIWDLLKDDTQPVVTERMDADRVTAMAVFGDSGQQNTYSGIALAHQSEKIEMHYFTRNFTVCSHAEEEKLESMTTEAF